MDYKSILEEQIRELQKVQDVAVKCSDASSASNVARTIIELVCHAQNLKEV